MQKKLQAHVDNYIHSMKEQIREILLDQGNTTTNECLEKIFAIDGLNINMDDFSRKKRVRNIIADCDRCCAFKAEKERCTRKKREGYNVCGTHLKGTPHGMIDNDINETHMKKIEVYTKDIGGVIYYVDNEKNVYSSTDIMKAIQNPTKIGYYTETFQNGSITNNLVLT